MRFWVDIGCLTGVWCSELLKSGYAIRAWSICILALVVGLMAEFAVVNAILSES